METQQGYKCLDCEAIINPEEDDIEVPLYECGNCGTRFNRDNSSDGCSHRCPDCNKFASKVSDTCCPECQEGELEEIEIVEIDGEWIDAKNDPDLLPDATDEKDRMPKLNHV